MGVGDKRTEWCRVTGAGRAWCEEVSVGVVCGAIRASNMNPVTGSPVH